MSRTLRYEGFDYVIQDGEIRPGVSLALRPGTKPPKERDEKGELSAEFLAWRSQTPNSQVEFATADLKDSGKGWHFLPQRVGPPLGGDYLEPANGAPGRWLIHPHPLRDAIRLHPLYIAGRDDLARERIETAHSA